MIEVHNLKKMYGSKVALKGITFDVKQGEIFGLLGSNGAGKSTTVKILTGRLLPGYGEVRILGVDALKDKGSILHEIGNVPEASNLYERLTVGQNLEFYTRLYDCKINRVDSLLEKVKLIGEKNTQVKKLSKGMKQRVLLCRALIHNPKVLFLDEPTSGLDPASANDIINLLETFNKEGMTILLTSHNMEEVDRLCHRVAFLDNGEIADTGSPEELKLRYGVNKMRVLLTNANSIEEHFINTSGEESAGLMAEWMKSGRIKSIHSCEPTLAEIFIKVTGRDLK
jgi:ABC-2 type transport system ATP-binding protein